MINVTKTFLPPLDEYVEHLKGIWERGQLTNHGPLVLQLEADIKRYLGVEHFYYMNNGTIALQIALRALNVTGTVITTPFSYVATTSTIVWEHAVPIFVDIDPATFNIDARLIEAAIRPDTTAILATHVYGIPCDVHAIEQIARKHGLKVIYDAAHAFGVKIDGRSLLDFGDASTVSFHATKLFHTCEGGGVATGDPAVAHKLGYMRNFGHNGQEEFWGLGINGKGSEIHAAMGLCVLPHIERLIERRRHLSRTYDEGLAGCAGALRRPSLPPGVEYNYAYYPVVFETDGQLSKVREALNANDIFPRRYFFPALNHLPYVSSEAALPVAEATSMRVLCLPLSHELPEMEIARICALIASALR